MEIISAARGTGKSTYIKNIQENNDIIVCINQNHIKSCRYDNAITIDNLIDDLKNSNRILGRGTRLSDYNLIFDEPGMYDLKFLQALKYIDKKQIKLVIGTPVTTDYTNAFNLFLEWNKTKVKIWSWQGDNSSMRFAYKSCDLLGTWK